MESYFTFRSTARYDISMLRGLVQSHANSPLSHNLWNDQKDSHRKTVVLIESRRSWMIFAGEQVTVSKCIWILVVLSYYK